MAAAMLGKIALFAFFSTRACRPDLSSSFFYFEINTFMLKFTSQELE